MILDMHDHRDARTDISPTSPQETPGRQPIQPIQLGQVVVASARPPCLPLGCIGVVRVVVPPDDPVLVDVGWMAGSAPWLDREDVSPFIGPLTEQQVEQLRRAAQDMQRSGVELDARLLAPDVELRQHPPEGHPDHCSLCAKRAGHVQPAVRK